jgi:hypothetical protein
MGSNSNSNNKRLGRPADAHGERYMLRHHAAQIEVWRLAAATCACSLGEWMRLALDSEAATATHVLPVRRKVAK